MTLTYHAARIAKIRTENHQGDVSSDDIEWLCSQLSRQRSSEALTLDLAKAVAEHFQDTDEPFGRMARNVIAVVEMTSDN